jgi:hypothetical protein
MVNFALDPTQMLLQEVLLTSNHLRAKFFLIFRWIRADSSTALNNFFTNPLRKA